VALDGQASSMHIGNRFPVITSSFSTVGGGQASNPGLSAGIQYIDLGLSLKLTPAVHEDSEVSLDLDAAFKTLGAASVNNIPEISNREYQGKVRLKAGEWAVIAGLITASDFPTITGVAGLADVPVLGNLFRHKTTEVARTETLVVIKPRIVNLPAWETVTKPLWTGSETRPITAF
jgi:general secretion pathway protein D